MFKWIIKFFGLRGSWAWACRQMEKGKVVRPASATGTVRYKLDNENQGRILWSFPHRKDPLGKKEKWENANIFLSDFSSTDWVCV